MSLSRRLFAKKNRIVPPLENPQKNFSLFTRRIAGDQAKNSLRILDWNLRNFFISERKFLNKWREFVGNINKMQELIVGGGGIVSYANENVENENCQKWVICTHIYLKKYSLPRLLICLRLPPELI